MTSQIGYVVAPDGQAGGGMGRVKDYILQSGGDRFGRVVLEPLVTRDGRGFFVSLLLTVRAISVIWWAQLAGRLAFVHVNFGDRASAVRKGTVVVLSRLVGAPVILHLHAVELHHQYAKVSPPIRWLIALPFRMSSCNILLGEVWRSWLVDTVGIPRERTDVVFNGVPVDFPGTRDFSNANPVKLLFLGNLIERKGVTDLVEAAAALSPDLPSWHLTLAGGGNPDHYRALAEDRGVSDHLSFLGWVDQTDARRLVASAECLVLPSYDEGLPLVILEALGSATPVICTPVGAIPEAIENGRDALFCKPGDRDELVRCLERVIRAPELRKQLSDAGRDAYVHKFSLPVFIASLFDVYRRRLGIAIEPASIDGS